MGQQNSYQIGKNSSLTQVQQLPIGKVFREQQTQALYFIKEYAYTSEEAFQQAFIKFSTKLTHKNPNILNLEKTNTKVENTFCSTFYKIILIFQYLDYSLDDQIRIRNKDNRTFQQKQIWSILFHCTLAMSSIRRSEGLEHSAISLKDIKISEDGGIKLIPSQMVGICSQHDQNEGTTKKLAMTILSCILMKPISNHSVEYLEALIDKTKCSKQLKKTLYLMILEDTTFFQLEDHIFKLSNDQNDSLISGVSTPFQSSHKKAIKQVTLHKSTQESKNLKKESSLLRLNVQQEDQPSIWTKFQTTQIENPDQNDVDKQVEENYNEMNQCPTYHQINECHTFAVQNSLSFKLKQHSPNNNDQVTVRIPSQKIIEIPIYSKTQFNNSQNLYTDPKLLDLIKKDLKEIQHKSRVSLSSAPRQSLNSNFTQKVEQIQRPKRQSIYNISSNNFNLKPIMMQNPTARQNENKPKDISENPQGVQQTNSLHVQDAFKDIQNIPKRSRQQECFGNILDEEASFKKNKNKKQILKDAQLKKDLNKENYFEQTQTKRLQSGTKNQFDSVHKAQKTKNNDTKLIPQQLRSNGVVQEQCQMEFVKQTYQKGQYQGTKLNGLRHGVGTFYYKEGGKYQGQWRQNKMNGKGTLYYPNDQIAYQGNWKDDQLNGYGTLYNEEVSQLQGSIQYQDWANVQQYWVKYEGQFNMDNKQGKGKWFLSNGQIFQGHFSQDAVDGQGVLSRTNGSRIRGIWRNNKLIRLY